MQWSQPNQWLSLQNPHTPCAALGTLPVLVTCSPCWHQLKESLSPEKYLRLLNTCQSPEGNSSETLSESTIIPTLQEEKSRQKEVNPSVQEVDVKVSGSPGRLGTSCVPCIMETKCIHLFLPRESGFGVMCSLLLQKSSLHSAFGFLSSYSTPISRLSTKTQTWL